MSPPAHISPASAGVVTSLDLEQVIAELAREIPPAVLPPVATTKHVAALIGSTESALSQDRYLGKDTIPYTKIGRRVRYLRADVLRFLAENRVSGAA